MFEFSKTVLNSEVGHTYLFSTGQAGFIIKNKAGKLLAIDLYLSDCVERDEGHIGFKRLLPKILAPNELDFDVIIATHPHLDHFDVDSMHDLVKEKTKLFASVNCDKLVDIANIPSSNVTYVKVDDKYSVSGFDIEFVRCDHGKTKDAVGVIVTVDDRKLFFAGDTCLRLDWIPYFKERGPFDFLIAAINGAYGNLNEEDCAILSKEIDARMTIPCHYGMFATHGGSPKVFMEKMGDASKYILLTQGERVDID